MPPHAVACAEEDLAALSLTLAAKRLWPMCEPPHATAHWWAPLQELTVLIHLPPIFDQACGPLQYSNLIFRWGELRTYSDDWYDIGWHWVSSPRDRDRRAAQLVSHTLNRRWAT